MKTIIPSPKILYKAKTHTIGGRSHGACRSSDSHLHVLLSTPGKLGSGQTLNNYLPPDGQLALVMH